MPRIKVPAVLAGNGGSRTDEVEATTLDEAFRAHAEAHGPSLRESVIEDGQIKEFVNVYVNGEEISHLDGLDTILDEDDLIRVIPAASGGGSRRRH